MIYFTTFRDKLNVYTDFTTECDPDSTLYVGGSVPPPRHSVQVHLSVSGSAGANGSPEALTRFLRRRARSPNNSITTPTMSWVERAKPHYVTSNYAAPASVGNITCNLLMCVA
ncbi:hypothetical protein J6590_081807 [Homalodisca vitripennis]|nr:hypothetical protein J6590_081807 [Homalodisca vitripennis]